MTFHAKVIAGGKVVTPAEIRREFGIEDGDPPVVARSGAGGVRFMTFDQAGRASRHRARAVFGEDDIVLDERRADRGEERRSSSLRLRLRPGCWVKPARTWS